MLDNIKEKFKNEPKVKRNVIITTVALATLFAATVVVANVVDNDDEFGSDKPAITAEVEAKSMGEYTVTISEGTKIGAEDLLRMAVKTKEEGITPLSASTELDIFADKDAKIRFKDDATEREYDKVGTIKEDIVVTSGEAVYEYAISVKVTKNEETTKPVTTTTKATTTSKPKTTTTTTTTTTKATTTTKKTQEVNNTPAQQPSGGGNGNNGGSNNGGGNTQTQETPQPVVTQAPATPSQPTATTPQPVVTTPPETQAPANDEPTGNFSFEGMSYKVDESAQKVYEGSGAGWHLVVNGGADWDKFYEAWSMEITKSDNTASKAIYYAKLSVYTYANCDVIYIPSCWTAEDVYDYYGLDFGGNNVIYGTYVDKAGDGTYAYAH